jgi:Mn-dependent DtxR family transcriptional regulator
MPDEKATPDFIAAHDHTELEILYLLTDPNDNQPIWSITDLARELDDRRISVEDIIPRLHGAGLIHRTSDGFVFATSSAVRQIQLVGHGVI